MKIKYSLLVIGLLIITGCGNKTDALKGKWIATPDNQKIYEDNEEITGGIENYYLDCDGKGYYDLTTKSEDLANARYTIKNNKVTFYDEGRRVLAKCKLDKNELDCLEKSYYAIKYVKKEK